MSGTWETGPAARSAPALQMEEGLRTGEQHFLCLFQIPSEGVWAVPPPWRQLQFTGVSATPSVQEVAITAAQFCWRQIPQHL